jgi:hypothetical protein
LFLSSFLSWHTTKGFEEKKTRVKKRKQAPQKTHVTTTKYLPFISWGKSKRAGISNIIHVLPYLLTKNEHSLSLAICAMMREMTIMCKSSILSNIQRLQVEEEVKQMCL